MLHVGDEVGGGEVGQKVLPRLAWVTFAILFAMNLLDYMDRYILTSVLPHIREDLGLKPDRAGWLGTYFLISYSLISPLMGWASDRTRRTWLLGLGVGVWALATVGTGLARNYGHLVLARSFLGIGEATYGVIAPTILMDLFPRERRARVLSAFYLAMPLGAALGISLGAPIADRSSWHMAFFVAGVPALVAALGAVFLPEPLRGASEGVAAERLKEHERAGASRADYLDLMVNSSYTYSVFGMATYTFAIGGLSFWFPSFLKTARGMENATTTLALTTLVASILGMSLGGWLADRLAKAHPQALFIVPGLAMLGSIPFIFLGLLAKSPVWIFAGIFLAETLMFVNTGPCNAVIANVVAPNLRGAAYAVALFAVHVLGDCWSQPLIGWVAEAFGQPDMMATSFGHVLRAIGAVPVVGPDRKLENLTAGLLLVVPAVLLSGVVLLAGARHLPREMALMLARLKAAPQPLE